MPFACHCDRGAMVFQHRAVRTNREDSCGCGSVGRASPCQGEGRGFESRHPLRGAGSAQPQHSHGGLAERLGTGLQSRLHRFESGTHLGRLAQRERASLTRKRSLVRSQYRAQIKPLAFELRAFVFNFLVSWVCGRDGVPLLPCVCSGGGAAYISSVPSQGTRPRFASGTLMSRRRTPSLRSRSKALSLRFVNSGLGCAIPA